MSVVRQRRLRADHESVTRAFAGHPFIRVRETEGDPPERYRFDMHLKGLVVQSGQVVEKDDHRVEVFLTLAYPRQAPQCRMLTPVFHPNIAPHAICVGDHWSAGESLAALIARIGEMITFQSYNTKSPLNGEAARWADEHVDRLPLQRVDLSLDRARPAAPEGAAPPPSPAGVVAPPPTRAVVAAPVPAAPDPRRLLAQAMSLARGGDLAGALPLLDRAVALDADLAEAYRSRGVVRSRLGDALGAAADFERALRLDPGHERAEWMQRYVRGARGPAAGR